MRPEEVVTTDRVDVCTTLLLVEEDEELLLGKGVVLDVVELAGVKALVDLLVIVDELELAMATEEDTLENEDTSGTVDADSVLVDCV